MLNRPYFHLSGPKKGLNRTATGPRATVAFMASGDVLRFMRLHEWCMQAARGPRGVALPLEMRGGAVRMVLWRAKTLAARSPKKGTRQLPEIPTERCCG
ncbi:hypothetical protein ACLOJK_039933 [Asimina triloba]